jgi:hypothetical protein
VTYSSKIATKLESLKFLAIELFDKAVHDKIINTSRRNTLNRESLDLEDHFRLNDSSYRDHDKVLDSFNPSMTHKDRSIKFSIALSKIPEKKMSNISIMDFKEILSGTCRVSRFRLKSENDHGMPSLKMNQDINLFADDQKQRSRDSDSHSVTKKSSYTRSSEKEKPDRMSTYRESIFTPNLPVSKDESKGYCCQLI